MSKDDLVVTRCDGVPLPDQQQAVEEFKRQCAESEFVYELKSGGAPEWVIERVADEIGRRDRRITSLRNILHTEREAQARDYDALKSAVAAMRAVLEK